MSGQPRGAWAQGQPWSPAQQWPQGQQRRRPRVGVVLVVVLLVAIVGGVVLMLAFRPAQVAGPTTGTQACLMLTQQNSVTPIVGGFITAIGAKTDQDTYAPHEPITVRGSLTSGAGSPIVNQAIHILIIGTGQTAVVRTSNDGAFSGEILAPDGPGTYTMIVQFPGTSEYEASCVSLVFVVSA